jgi:hypothetical protein
MAFVHAKNTFVSLNGSDLSTFSDNSTMTLKSDLHDVTTYGKNDHVYQGGLGDGTASISGTYDNGASGPRDVIVPLRGSTVTFIRRPEGTGSGLPQDSVSVVVGEYGETAAVADYVKWSVTLQLSDAVTSTNQ